MIYYQISYIYTHAKAYTLVFFFVVIFRTRIVKRRKMHIENNASEYECEVSS